MVTSSSLVIAERGHSEMSPRLPPLGDSCRARANTEGSTPARRCRVTLPTRASASLADDQLRLQTTPCRSDLLEICRSGLASSERPCGQRARQCSAILRRKGAGGERRCPRRSSMVTVFIDFLYALRPRSFRQASAARLDLPRRQPCVMPAGRSASAGSHDRGMMADRSAVAVARRSSFRRCPTACT